MPTFVTERMLKRLATHAMQTFDNDVAAGSRTGLSEEELARDEPVSGADESRKKGGPTPRVRQAKIIRQADRVDPLTGKGRSKGYGFLELREHADALRVLRWTNNNLDVPPLLAEWWPAELQAEKKGADPHVRRGSQRRRATGAVLNMREARLSLSSQSRTHKLYTGAQPAKMW
jgi:nucleolar protein 4